jgi:hypothetical protein
MPAAARHVLVFVGLSVLAALALYPFCGFVFGCGCVMAGLGGAARCNVHHPTGPHCPWCEHAWLGMVGLVLILAVQAVAYALVIRRGRSAAAGAFAAVLAFPLAAVLGAFLTWLPTDYPHFLGRDTRSAWGLPAGPLRCIRPELRPPRAEADPAPHAHQP